MDVSAAFWAATAEPIRISPTWLSYEVGCCALIIGIVGYGAGNIKSLHNALEWVGAEALVVEEPAQFDRVGALILPGVGAFGSAMHRLEAADFVEPLQNWARSGKPLLGICLGMQLLGRESEEGGITGGLGLVDARVVRLQSAPGVRVPHVGWNTVRKVREAGLWRDLDGATCYHVHSYCLAFDDSETKARWTIGTVDHGRSVISMVEHENVMGVQFHPEKSQRDGLAILDNFLKASAC